MSNGRVSSNKSKLEVIVLCIAMSGLGITITLVGMVEESDTLTCNASWAGQSRYQ